MSAAILTLLYYVSSWGIWCGTQLGAEELIALDRSGVHRINRENLTPIERMLIWETEKNFSYLLRRSSIEFPVQVKAVNKSQVHIGKLEGMPDWLNGLFIQNGSILVPQHPFNNSVLVPFASAPHIVEWKGYLTASRTMVFIKGNRAFAVKMPTDYASPIDKDFRNKDKANMIDDVDLGFTRSMMIEHIDSLIGEDPRLKVLLETMVIADKKTGNGITIRDLSKLMDGFLYLPGTATYEVFKEKGDEALKKAMEQSAFNYGQAQALMLIRYGLSLEYPHRQNALDQLSLSMEMTNTSVVRDVADTLLVEPVVKLLLPEAIDREIMTLNRLRDDLKPNTMSVTTMKGIIPQDEILHLEKILNKAFDKTVATELQISEGTPIGSKVFLEAIAQYHKRKRSILRR